VGRGGWLETVRQRWRQPGGGGDDPTAVAEAGRAEMARLAVGEVWLVKAAGLVVGISDDVC
jgi:hypothetical protein